MTSALKNDYLYHGHMLADKTRLIAYKEALREQLSAGDSVLEIGSGTGILSLIAASLGPNRVDALEYFADLCSLSTRNAAASEGLQPTFTQASSFAFKANTKADGIFSETIGSWGPEENIVEIFADYVNRNPGARWLMPSTLTLFGQEIRSSVIEDGRDAIQNACDCAAEISGRNFSTVAEELEIGFTTNLQCTTFAPESVEVLSEPRVVHSYRLGHDFTSCFQTELSFQAPQANAWHFWFEAKLSESITLSSHLSAPPTHWRHLYLPRANSKNKTAVGYMPATRSFDFKWKQ